MKKKDITALIEGLRRISEDFSQLADVLDGSDQKKSTEAVSMENAVPENEPIITATGSDPGAAMGSALPGSGCADTEKACTEAEAETHAYTFEQVRGILAEKSRAGAREKVKALIVKYGGAQLSDYKDKPEILAKLVKEAEGI